MSDEQDSWLSGIGVDVGGIIDSATAAVGSAASGVMEAIAAPVKAVESLESSAAGSPPPEGGNSSLTGMVSGAIGSVGNAFQEAKNDAAAALGSATDGGGQVLQGAMNADLTNDASKISGGSDSSSLTGIVDNVIGGIATTLEKAGDIIDTPNFPPRPLKDRERSYARAIFGDSLDYSVITVIGGGAATLDGDLGHSVSRTIGNDINLEPGLFDPSGDVSDKGLETLVHEMAHVWQFQNHGFSYIREALWAQAVAQVVQGDSSLAYDWEGPLARNVPFEDWNPEAQAEAVEDYNKALRAIQGGSTDPKDYETFSKLKDLFGKMSAGPVHVREPLPHPEKDGKPQLSKLTPKMREDCEDYLAVHHFAAVAADGLGLTRDGYQPAIDGHPTTIEQVVADLRRFTILDASDELNDLVQREFDRLVNVALASAKDRLENPSLRQPPR